MKLTRTSPLTGESNTLELAITQEEYNEWKQNRTLIQNAFPHLSDDEREFILTGYLPGEFEQAVGPEEPEGLDEDPEEPAF